MLSRILGILPLFFSVASLAGSPLTITSPKLSGDCKDDDIAVVEEGGEYYIAAYFANMDAIADTKVLDKKSCRMNYQVDLAAGYKLDLFQFSVDGVYQLSDHGTGRLTVSHRVANNSSARTTKFFSATQGDPTAGDIHDFSGAISKDQLPAQYTQCGANIPLTTSVYTEAVKPASDQSGLTRVSLDEGVSGHYVKLCKVVVSPCQH